jgi:transposase-like protein
MEQLAVIESFVRGVRWGDDHRLAARQVTKAVLEERMKCFVDWHLEQVDIAGEKDRRNGYYSRHLLTELGDIELHIPRTRQISAVKVINAYARRCTSIDRLILSCFILGLSTRKVSEALLTILGERISATTVSRVAKILDASVAGFHRRRLNNFYRALILDGVVLKRKTGAGSIKQFVLVALGIRPDGRKDVIDFRVARSESAADWERFLTSLHNRGLDDEHLELICVDGGQGLLSAVPTVYPDVDIQRCWAHKMRNLTDKARKADRERVKKNLQRIYNARNIVSARRQAALFARNWSEAYPKVVRSLRNDLVELLHFFRFNNRQWRKATRTTNAIERRFREVKRRTRPMGVFSDKTSMERILFAVFTHENKKQGAMTPFLVTHNC